jgi:hypothetical protein
MQKNHIGKILAIGIIVLFIGVGIHPAFAIVNITLSNSFTSASKNKEENDELVEITLHICKPDNLENHIIKITQQQANDFFILFDGFSEKVNKAKTLKEKLEIYLDIFESLNKIGFLIDDTSVKEIQQMIRDRYACLNIAIFLNKFLKIDKMKTETMSNRLCLIHGGATSSIFINPLAILVRRFSEVFDMLHFYCWLFYLDILEKIFYDLYTYYNLILPDEINKATENKEKHFGSYVGIGGRDYKNFQWGEHLFANGNINTSGLDGDQWWSGTMRGEDYYKRELYVLSEKIEYYPGIIGFIGTGWSYKDRLYFIGYASSAKIKLYSS